MERIRELADVFNKQTGRWTVRFEVEAGCIDISITLPRTPEGDNPPPLGIYRGSNPAEGYNALHQFLRGVEIQKKYALL